MSISWSEGGDSNKNEDQKEVKVKRIETEVWSMEEKKSLIKTTTIL